MMKIGRAICWGSSLILTCALCGAAQQRGEARKPGQETDIQSSLKQFSAVYGLIEKNYADPVDPNRALYGPSGSDQLGAIPECCAPSIRTPISLIPSSLPKCARKCRAIIMASAWRSPPGLIALGKL